MNLPLAGVRVLDLTRLLPGPMCTLHLADMGADVIKVEDPEVGDYARTLDVREGQASVFFSLINRNKRSLALDLKHSSARAAFLRLAARADVVVEGFRPGVAARLGIDWDNVRRVNARVVYCSLSGYGQTGPYRERAGHDINYLGLAGVLDQIGASGGAPTLSNLQIADLLGGTLCAATAILAALVGAKTSGVGRYIDLSMSDAVLAHNIFALHGLATRGVSEPRGEALLTGGVPCYGVYRTKDARWLAVGALERKFWDTLCDTLERPDLKPLHLATGEDGRATRRVLEVIFARETLAHWSAQFEDVDCCVSPVLTAEEALAHEQFAAREMIVGKGKNAQYASPFKMSDAPFEITRPAPRLGEHTEEVLREAGFTPSEIEALASS